jgi:hypothetical protein
VPHRNELIASVIAALIWIAAFAFATGIFLSLTLLLRFVPPTPPVAIGRVTIEGASKARDYLGAALFFILIAPLTIALYRAGDRVNRKLRRATPSRKDLVSLLFVLPFFLAPFLFLTTQKWGWPVAVPLALSALLTRGLIAFETKSWLRDLFHRELRPFHTLIVAEALSWIAFRYIAAGKRLAHFPTLFLEIPFVVLFVVLFIAALVLIARSAQFVAGVPAPIALQRLTVAAVPLLALPALGLMLVPGNIAILMVMACVVVLSIGAVTKGERVDATAIRRATMFFAIPLLLYCISYVQTAATWQALDLFHRGESLGPASDYVRGKVPYRDVFVLHGMLSDGLIDAWLIDLFGRDAWILFARPALFGAFAAPALWLLGCAVFDSAALAGLVVILGAVTTVDNERALLEIAVVALLLAALRRQSRALFAMCGVASAFALFYSLDVGLYSIAGTLLALALLRRWTSIAWWLAGAAAGAVPFIVYLVSRGALAAFLDVSFVAIPRIIDAVWSLPFPSLVATFRNNLTLHSISDFFLYERFRFVLSPLIIGVAIVYLVWRRRGAPHHWLYSALLTLVIFAVFTQRSALGRADFQHQYFSAFLIAPILVILFALLARAPRSLALAAAIVLLPILAVVLWVPDLVNARVDDATRYVTRVRNDGDEAASLIRARVANVCSEVHRISRRGEPMFDFSNQPALYFFCDQTNPTRFYQVPVMSPRESQREAIVALEREKPIAVIRRSPQDFDQFDGVDNSVRAQAVSAYLDDHYTYESTRFGVEIWKRRPRSSSLSADAYLTRIRIPSLKELGVIGIRHRVVFPWMTNGAGGNRTQWRSDLVLHNPLTVPMSLRLRYIAGDTRVDREFVLAPSRSIRWDDSIRTLFRAPETGGAVWIEYHGDRAPVARGQTYDWAHDRGGSIFEPLSQDDAAQAGAARDQLSILGFSARHQLINVGVVNVGDTPMSFRITVVQRDGTRAGRTVQQGVNEGEAFVITNAEKQLGVPLDPTMTVHVAVLSGSAVAFANTIESNGDTEFLAGVPSARK